MSCATESQKGSANYRTQWKASASQTLTLLPRVVRDTLDLICSTSATDSKTVRLDVSPTGNTSSVQDLVTAVGSAGLTNQITFIFTKPYQNKMISEQLHVEQVWTTLSQTQLFPPRASGEENHLFKRQSVCNGRQGIRVRADSGGERSSGHHGKSHDSLVHTK